MSNTRKNIIVHLGAGNSITEVAKRFCIHRSNVYRIKEKYNTLGTTANKPKTGGPRMVRTKEKVEEVRAAIKENPSTSFQKLSRDHDRPEATMRRLVKEDLGYKSLSKTPVQALMVRNHETRVERGRKIIQFLRTELNGHVLVFSDKKDFYMDKKINRHYNQYMATSTKAVDPKLRFMGQSKHPQKASMLGIIMSDGKMLPLIWYEGTMDMTKYKNILARKVFLVLDATYGCGGYVWTQDGAPCHTSRITQYHIERRLGSG